MMKPGMIILLGVAVLSLAGCRQAQPAQPASSSQSATSQSATSSQAKPQAPTATIKVSLDQAWQHFLQQFPQAHVTSVELEPAQGRYHYTLEGQDPQNEVKLTLDAENGKVVQHSQESLEADDQEAALSRSGLVTRQRASKIAITQAGGGSAVAWQLDRDDGQVVWEVTVQTTQGNHEVTLDAYSAEILSAENDD